MAQENAAAALVEETAARDITIAALGVLLDCGAPHTGLQELGRLSSCSAPLKAAAGTAWHALFTKAARVASGSCSAYDPSPYCSIPCPCGYCDFVEWLKDSEELDHGSFHACFANPEEAVLECAGYARAARCLLSKICHKCGDLACRANPVTLNRTCVACAEKDDAAALVLGKYISFFYLDCNDVASLPRATIDASIIGGRGGPSTVYLISDVLAAADAKFEGGGGFLVERERRLEAKRPTRKNPGRSAASDNPYKRARVVEDFDPLSFRCTAAEALPIGIMEYLPVDSPDNKMGKCEEWKSRQPICCAFCSVEGLPDDIKAHEWFAHGSIINTQVQRGEVRHSMTESDFSLTHAQTLEDAHILEVPEELRRRMEAVSAQISYLKDIRFQEEEYLAKNLTLWECMFDLGNGVSIAMSFRDRSVDYVDGAVGVQSTYLLCIEAQIGGKNKPARKLAEMYHDGHEEFWYEKEAGAKKFAEVLSALGLQEDL
ncbi:hypothetical protein ACHAXT_002927 [Thalassiosira profunda]